MKNIQFKTGGQDVKLQFQGKITINADIIRAIIAEMRPPNPTPDRPPVIIPETPPLPAALPRQPLAASPPPDKADIRLAYTMEETAKILGVSYITVHRLIKRGFLKSSIALRHKLIPKAEIERFLKQTI